MWGGNEFTGDEAFENNGRNYSKTTLFREHYMGCIFDEEAKPMLEAWYKSD
ncbi:MAG: hypothetical protein LBB61_06735 [Treponema sp.]|nr:hypothetical protein [Treponema sp.]